MDGAAFEKQLGRISHELTLIVGCHRLWVETWPTPERVGLLNGFPGFFQFQREAVRTTALLAATRVLDPDSRTVSIPNLVAAAKREPQLVPHASPGLFKSIDMRLRAGKKTIAALKLHRNKRLVHFDATAFTPQPLRKDDFEDLLATLQKIFNDISNAHDRSSTSWWKIETDSERHTQNMLQQLAIGVQEYHSSLDRQLKEESARLEAEAEERRRRKTTARQTEDGQGEGPTGR